MPETRIPVLIAGGGTVGLAAALFLAHHGVASLVVERQPGPSVHPRATGLGPRTVEFLRQAGLDEAVDAVAIDMSAGNLGKISAGTLAEADLPAVAAAGPAHPQLGPRLTGRVSPGVLRGTCPQNRLDAVLLPAARGRGATVRYATRLVSFEQDDDGITALLDTGDAPGGSETVRADYLVAADGVRSGVRDALGIATSGPGELGSPMVNILFRADLTAYTHGHSFVTCDITHPDAPGLLVTVDGEKEWIFHAAYDPGAGRGADDFTPARCRALIRAAIGAPDLEVEVVSTLPWRPRGLLADHFRAGRVFLAGDAASRTPKGAVRDRSWRRRCRGSCARRGGRCRRRPAAAGRGHASRPADGRRGGRSGWGRRTRPLTACVPPLRRAAGAGCGTGRRPHRSGPVRAAARRRSWCSARRRTSQRCRSRPPGRGGGCAHGSRWASLCTAGAGVPAP